ncbi:MAG TPA: thiol peroxidase [Synergistales bacterium]|nr:thiol peroxidase [Synergistales bacterium]HRV70753.1 thiol peroxidase [Thermovirgaceae bacterium]
MERNNSVTMKGNPVTLSGPGPKVGEKVPGFSVLDQDLKPVSLDDFAGRIKVISVTPSLDTPVCDLQAHWFNEEASSLPSDVEVINISMDLPFAIRRFCVAGGIDSVRVLSDHRDASFGKGWGILISELRLLARAVFVVDRDNILRYVEIVPEVTSPPDYDSAMEALKSLI